MQVKVLFGYAEQVVPPRCRKPRTVRFDDGQALIEIREVTAAQAPVAIRARGVIDYDESRPFTLDYRWFEGGLWTATHTSNAQPRPIEVGGKDCAYPKWPETLDVRRAGSRNENWAFGYNEKFVQNPREDVLAMLHEFAGQHLIVDGVAHRPAGEPRYVVMTFGLGRNHGGTACMVDDGYNGNIPHTAYFSLLDRDKAIERATLVATRRGDTKSLPIKPHGPDFEVLIPEAIQVRPAEQHGNGDPFLNTLEGLSQASGGSPVVGLVAGLAALSGV